MRVGSFSSCRFRHLFAFLFVFVFCLLLLLFSFFLFSFVVVEEIAVTCLFAWCAHSCGVFCVFIKYFKYVERTMQQYLAMIP